MPASAASSSQSPKKAKPYDAADKVKAPTGIKKRRQEWIKSLPAAWVVERGFTHPKGTMTVAKGLAMKTYRLIEREISTLPYVPDITKQGHSMRLYAAEQLAALATRKSKALQTPLPEVLKDLEQHCSPPKPPPLMITDYTCPPQVTTADPAIITWEPSKLRGPVNVKEACRLYCVSPEEIRDLSDHSPSIDLGSVARRAVTLHGGFHAHKALVRQRRDQEEASLADARKRKSDFTFSEVTLKQLASDAEDPYMLSHSFPQLDYVAVLYPIQLVAQNNYKEEWEPYWGDF